ncbi:hypothetical protein HBJ58_22310 [Halomonas desiderata]|uniref:LysR substrate-binding domain-containing protein n=1 Tax=Billgrantia desiderata TaxID=52021 RepID=UPI00174B647F|nr:hypothetical protein [Halomonas desiderata]
MNGNLIVNDTETYIACGLEGLGLIRAANYMVMPHLRSGQLQRVLGHIQAPTVPISVLYPHNRHLSPIVRAFVDLLVELMPRVERQWQADLPR